MSGLSKFRNKNLFLVSELKNILFSNLKLFVGFLISFWKNIITIRSPYDKIFKLSPYSNAFCR